MPLQPLSSYAIAKVAGWEFCKQYSRLYGLSCVSLRPTMIYGPRQSFNLVTFVAKSILEGAPQVLLDGGSQTRDPLFVERMPYRPLSKWFAGVRRFPGESSISAVAANEPYRR